jgi:hypothetical protein
MTFLFNPLSDDQINAIQNRTLLADGIYPFVVKNVEQQVSKSSIAMLKVKLVVVAAENDMRVIFDYLLATEQMMFKLKHFCESIGIADKYEKGSFEPSDCIERSGKVKIGVQKGAAKDDGSGFYPDKNSVKDYVKSEGTGTPKEKVPKEFDDDILF